MIQSLFSLFKTHIRIPILEKAGDIIKSFSLFEKIVFYSCAAIFALSSFYMMWQINNNYMVTIPSKGGSFIEGVVGSPRFINPILAMSDADKDMTSLVYSGLLKATPEGGLENDLAKEWKVSEDGLTYTFTLKDNIKFHDGSEITTDDVIFTIQKIQDPYLKSPKALYWKGVTINKIDDKTLTFSQKEPYAPFIENATIGILPKNLWKNASNDEFPFSQLNSEPVGSGPYKVTSVKRNSSGLPVYYELRSFEEYALGEAYISKIVMRFYPNETEAVTAYKNGDIQILHGTSPEATNRLKENGAKVETTILPRIFGVFLNQNQASVLGNHEVREALNISIDREKIIKEVLGGYGSPIYSPIPLSFTSAEKNESDEISAATEAAKEILQSNGWEPNENTGIMEKKIKKQTVQLAFTLSTTNSEELKRAAAILQSEWEKIGAKVDIKVYEYGDFSQNVMRPRKYDAILFGEIIGRDMDLYPFWHSSERNDPGFNLSLYTNITADKLLNDAKKIFDPEERAEKYAKFEQEVKKDIPAIFLYSPDFTYIVPETIKNINIGKITVPQERFLNISKWYIKTDRVWKIFANKN